MCGLPVPVPAASGAPPGVVLASGFEAENGFFVLPSSSVLILGFFSIAFSNPLSLLTGLPELFAVPVLFFSFVFSIVL